MGTRFTILALLGITTYAALVFACVTQLTPFWRFMALYAIAMFTPGLFLPLIARGFSRRTRQD